MLTKFITTLSIQINETCYFNGCTDSSIGERDHIQYFRAYQHFITENSISRPHMIILEIIVSLCFKIINVILWQFNNWYRSIPMY